LLASTVLLSFADVVLSTSLSIDVGDGTVVLSTTSSPATLAQYRITFYGRNLQMFVIS
jgi:hypothetical protein